MGTVEAVAAAGQPERAALFEGAAASEEAACDGAVAAYDCWAPPMGTIETVAAARLPEGPALLEGAAAFEEAACGGAFATHDC